MEIYTLMFVGDVKEVLSSNLPRSCSKLWHFLVLQSHAQEGLQLIMIETDGNNPICSPGLWRGPNWSSGRQSPSLRGIKFKCIESKIASVWVIFLKIYRSWWRKPGNAQSSKLVFAMRAKETSEGWFKIVNRNWRGAHCDSLSSA